MYTKLLWIYGLWTLFILPSKGNKTECIRKNFEDKNFEDKDFRFKRIVLYMHSFTFSQMFIQFKVSIGQSILLENHANQNLFDALPNYTVIKLIWMWSVAIISL